MKFITAISALFVCVVGSPSGYIVPITPISSQYHTQDALGQYSYGYSNHHSAKAEARSLDGSILGSYSYLDPYGKIQSVEYTASDDGFRVAASNLPVGPVVPEIPAVAAPVAVQDTAEVVEARAQHLALVQQIKSRADNFEENKEDNTEKAEAKSSVVTTDIASNSDGKPVAVTSSVPVPSLLPISYRSAVYATPGFAFQSYVSPAVAVRSVPATSFSYSHGIDHGFYGYNSLYYYPRFATYVAPVVADQVVPNPVLAADPVIENAELAKARSDDEKTKEEKASQ